MSAEAYAFAWRNAKASRLTGTNLLVVLAMAHFVKERKPPFICECSAATIADMTGMTTRHAQRVLADLEQKLIIQIVQKGSGRHPNLYQFGRVDTTYVSVQDTTWASYLREDSTETA